MKNILAILLVAVFALPLMAQEKPRPADQNKYYLTIVTHPDWAKRPQERKLIEDLKAKPMITAAQSCHFNHITTSDEMYKNRWAALYPDNRLPAIIVQEPNGGYCFKASGPNVPSGSQAIYDTIRAYKEMVPEDRVRAFDAMEAVFEPAPEYVPDEVIEGDEVNNRRRPFAKDDPAPDMAEVFGGKTPLRDTMSSAAMIFLAILAIGLVMIFGVMALIAFFLVVKYWK